MKKILFTFFLLIIVSCNMDVNKHINENKTLIVTKKAKSIKIDDPTKYLQEIDSILLTHNIPKKTSTNLFLGLKANLSKQKYESEIRSLYNERKITNLDRLEKEFKDISTPYYQEKGNNYLYKLITKNEYAKDYFTINPKFTGSKLNTINLIFEIEGLSAKQFRSYEYDDYYKNYYKFLTSKYGDPIFYSHNVYSDSYYSSAFWISQGKTIELEEFVSEQRKLILKNVCP